MFIYFPNKIAILFTFEVHSSSDVDYLIDSLLSSYQVLFPGHCLCSACNTAVVESSFGQFLAWNNTFKMGKQHNLTLICEIKGRHKCTTPLSLKEKQLLSYLLEDNIKYWDHNFVINKSLNHKDPKSSYMFFRVIYCLVVEDWVLWWWQHFICENKIELKKKV